MQTAAVRTAAICLGNYITLWQNWLVVKNSPSDTSLIFAHMEYWQEITSMQTNKQTKMNKQTLNAIKKQHDGLDIGDSEREFFIRWPMSKW